MPLSSLLKSAAGTCPFCNQKAGIFSREHPECLRAHQVSRASTKHASGAEQKCTSREVIGQRKCPGQLFGRSVTEAGWQKAGE